MRGAKTAKTARDFYHVSDAGDVVVACAADRKAAKLLIEEELGNAIDLSEVHPL